MDENEKKANSQNSNSSDKKNTEEKPNKNLKPPDFFLISEGVISKTETADLSELVNEKKEKYSTNK
jgi:hypothetical protein